MQSAASSAATDTPSLALSAPPSSDRGDGANRANGKTALDETDSTTQLSSDGSSSSSNAGSSESAEPPQKERTPRRNTDDRTYWDGSLLVRNDSAVVRPVPANAAHANAAYDDDDDDDDPDADADADNAPSLVPASVQAAVARLVLPVETARLVLPGGTARPEQTTASALDSLLDDRRPSDTSQRSSGNSNDPDYHGSVGHAHPDVDDDREEEDEDIDDEDEDDVVHNGSLSHRSAIRSAPAIHRHVPQTDDIDTDEDSHADDIDDDDDDALSGILPGDDMVMPLNDQPSEGFSPDRRTGERERQLVQTYQRMEAQRRQQQESQLIRRANRIAQQLNLSHVVSDPEDLQDQLLQKASHVTQQLSLVDPRQYRQLADYQRQQLPSLSHTHDLDERDHNPSQQSEDSVMPLHHDGSSDSTPPILDLDSHPSAPQQQSRHRQLAREHRSTRSLSPDKDNTSTKPKRNSLQDHFDATANDRHIRHATAAIQNGTPRPFYSTNSVDGSMFSSHSSNSPIRKNSNHSQSHSTVSSFGKHHLRLFGKDAKKKKDKPRKEKDDNRSKRSLRGPRSLFRKTVNSKHGSDLMDDHSTRSRSTSANTEQPAVADKETQWEQARIEAQRIKEARIAQRKLVREYQQKSPPPVSKPKSKGVLNKLLLNRPASPSAQQKRKHKQVPSKEQRSNNNTESAQVSHTQVKQPQKASRSPGPQGQHQPKKDIAKALRDLSPKCNTHKKTPTQRARALKPPPLFRDDEEEKREVGEISANNDKRYDEAREHVQLIKKRSMELRRRQLTMQKQQTEPSVPPPPTVEDTEEIAQHGVAESTVRTAEQDPDRLTEQGQSVMAGQCHVEDSNDAESSNGHESARADSSLTTTPVQQVNRKVSLPSVPEGEPVGARPERSKEISLAAADLAQALRQQSTVRRKHVTVANPAKEDDNSSIHQDDNSLDSIEADDRNAVADPQERAPSVPNQLEGGNDSTSTAEGSFSSLGSGRKSLQDRRKRVQRQKEQLQQLIKSATAAAAPKLLPQPSSATSSISAKSEKHARMWKCQLQNLQTAYQEKEAEAARLERDIEAMKLAGSSASDARQKEKIRELMDQLVGAQDRIEAQAAAIQELECQLRDQDDEIQSLQYQIVDKSKKIAQLEVDLETHDIQYTQYAVQRQRLEAAAFDGVGDRSTRGQETDSGDQGVDGQKCATLELVSKMMMDYSDLVDKYREEKLAHNTHKEEWEWKTNDFQATVAVLEDRLSRASKEYPSLLHPTADFLSQRIFHLEKTQKELQQKQRLLEEELSSKQRELDKERAARKAGLLRPEPSGTVGIDRDELQRQEEGGQKSRRYNYDNATQVKEQAQRIANLEAIVQEKDMKIAALRTEAIHAKWKHRGTSVASTATPSSVGSSVTSGLDLYPVPSTDCTSTEATIAAALSLSTSTPDEESNEMEFEQQQEQVEYLRTLLQEREEEMHRQREESRKREVMLLALLKQSEEKITVPVSERLGGQYFM